jgi:hemoglobin/transferrin/lactoferrin receptor protein
VVALPAGLSAFGQYARGFRAPAFSSVNSGFTNVASGYTTLPNPDLEPETSATVEAGLRLTRSRGNASLTLFRNRFHDFIESVATGVNPATRLLEFQPRNVGEAVISGVELGGEARLGQAWTLRASAALIDGENETTQQPLSSIAPATGVLGLRYVRPGHRPGNRWGGELITTLTAGKDEDDVDRTVVRQFAPEGSEVVDLTLFFDPTDRMSLTVGVFNLFDESYFAWPDVIGRTEGSPVLDRYTRPGRSLAAAFRLRR